MPLPIEDVTANTPCPSVLGGPLHYPRTVSGRPVTMPYAEERPYGIQQHVMRSLCGNRYLLPPRDTDAQLAHEIHATCAEMLHSSQHSNAPDEAR
jgi:hypothetical protein